MRNPLEKLKSGLKKTHDSLTSKIAQIFGGKTVLDEGLIDKLEEVLIEADVGVDATFRLLEDLREQTDTLDELNGNSLQKFMCSEIKELLSDVDSKPKQAISQSAPHIIMVVGVNGSGKTTTAGKLARKFKDEGKSVILAAADTFRAAAMEQLEMWAARADAEIVINHEAHDPASVAFDAVNAAKARDIDVLIVDTAGRLHTQKNLMQELQKIHRVLGKQMPDAPHEILLVLDATTGQNAIQQARKFNSAVPLTGLVLAKLDGTAKGGVVVAISRELNIPVRFIGIGEQITDLQPFDPNQFAEALFY